MSKHGLIRNEANEPVCECGRRPEVLDTVTDKPIGLHWKAKNDVLNHITNLTQNKASLPFETLRHELKYPRAGVRQAPTGRWIVTLWDGPDVMHGHEQPFHDTRVEAIDYGSLIIGAHRQTGTALNGRGR